MTAIQIFTKARVANISSAAVIFWTLALWTYVIQTIMQGGIVIQTTANNIEVQLSPAMAIVITILAMLNAFAGFAAKHLWDSANVEN